MNKWEKIDLMCDKAMNINIKMMLWIFGSMFLFMFAVIFLRQKYGIDIEEMYTYSIGKYKGGIFSWYIALGFGIVIFTFGATITIVIPLSIYTWLKKSMWALKKPFDPKVITQEIISKKVNETFDKIERSGSMITEIHEKISKELTLEYQMRCISNTEFTNMMMQEIKSDEFMNKLKDKKIKKIEKEIIKFMVDTAEYCGWDNEDPQIKNYIHSEVKQLTASFTAIIQNSDFLSKL